MRAWLIEFYTRYNPCDDARRWLKAGDYPSLQAAWNACQRGDWMLWVWAKLDGGEPYSDTRRPLVGAAIECAALALPIYEAQFPGDKRVRNCLDLCARWAAGEQVNHDELVAAAAAYAAAADYAAYAAADYAAAAAGNADVSARPETLATCAEIVRRWRPVAPLCEAENADA